MSKPALTAERLRERLDYDAETGVFTWRLPPPFRRPGDIAGYLNKVGYWILHVDGARHLAHRLAWLYMTGEWPSAHIDHINRHTEDNRWANLREATRTENHANCKRYKNNRSGFKGVCYFRPKKKWFAQISINGKRPFLGYFNTPEEAHAAYVEAAQKYFGEFARSS